MRLVFFINMKTQGQIEDQLTKKSVSFFKDLFGIGPTEAKTYILEDMIIIRLKGPLLPIERKLLFGKKGIELVKHIRKNLHLLTVDDISNMINELTGQTVVSTHSDISTKTGEIMEVFILNSNYQKQLESQANRNL